MTSTGWAGVIIAILIVVGLGWYFATRPAAVATNTNVTVTDNTASTTDNTPAAGSDQGQPDTGVTGSVGVTVGTPKTVTITYGASGFSPKNVSINAGDTVTFVDQAGTPMWVASDQHPSHTEFDGTSRTTHCAAGYTGPKPFDQCGTGTSYSFTFTKAGSFDFHNHVAAQFEGVVVVK